MDCPGAITRKKGDAKYRIDLDTKKSTPSDERRIVSGRNLSTAQPAVMVQLSTCYSFLDDPWKKVEALIDVMKRK